MLNLNRKLALHVVNQFKKKAFKVIPEEEQVIQYRNMYDILTRLAKDAQNVFPDFKIKTFVWNTTELALCVGFPNSQEDFFWKGNYLITSDFIYNYPDKEIYIHDSINALPLPERIEAHTLIDNNKSKCFSLLAKYFKEIQAGKFDAIIKAQATVNGDTIDKFFN